MGIFQVVCLSIWNGSDYEEYQLHHFVPVW